MPILKSTQHTAPVYDPEGPYQVVKYMDITKFISMLQRRSLFFCRMDYLEDHFEGAVPEANYTRRREFVESAYRFMHQGESISQEELDEQIKELYEGNEKMKSVTCISCWNRSDTESAALWKIYSDFNKGLLITSNVPRVIEAFKDTIEDIQISEVRYIDYGVDAIPDGNTNWPMIHKHKAFDYESEVRLLHAVNFGAGFSYDWSQEEIESGKYIRVNLNRLIDEIVISPYAQVWYFDLIKDICEKYGLGDKPILKSALSRK